MNNYDVVIVGGGLAGFVNLLWELTSKASFKPNTYSLRATLKSTGSVF